LADSTLFSVIRMPCQREALALGKKLSGIETLRTARTSLKKNHASHWTSL
jgi:hypothetical protein